MSGSLWKLPNLTRRNKIAEAAAARRERGVGSGSELDNPWNGVWGHLMAFIVAMIA